VRSIRPANREESEKIITRVIDERVADGQLGECDLTLRDLEMARAVFISTLKGIYHPRIKYPASEGAARQSTPGMEKHVDA